MICLKTFIDLYGLYEIQFILKRNELWRFHLD